jgi:hypothetical protein
MSPPYRTCPQRATPPHHAHLTYGLGLVDVGADLCVGPLVGLATETLHGHAGEGGFSERSGHRAFIDRLSLGWFQRGLAPNGGGLRGRPPPVKNPLRNNQPP